MGLSRMLRMYILQQVMGFSDEGTEDAVYDSAAIQLLWSAYLQPTLLHHLCPMLILPAQIQLLAFPL